MIEIERKYLVTSNDFLNEYYIKNDIFQGYILDMQIKSGV